MKSPIRSATLVLSESMPSYYRRINCRPLTLSLLLSMFLILPLRAQVGLPRVAMSIPTDQSVRAGLTAAQQCEVPGKLIGVPPPAFHFGGHFEIPAGFLEQNPQNAAGAPIWPHNVMEADFN